MSEYTLYAHKQAAGRIMATYQFGHGCTATRVFGEVYGDCSAEAQAHAERVSACWNVCAGIPTEALEAGVVVVPVDAVYTTACLLRKITDQDGLTHYDRQAATDLANELDSVLSRLQQNGGEEE